MRESNKIMKRKGEVIMKNLKKFAAMGMMAVMLVSSFGLTGCGVSKTEKIEGSAGLVYELSEDGTYYIMTDGTACTEENVVIGNWHEENGKGLPVKAVGEWAFTHHDGNTIGAKTLTVSEGITQYGEGGLSDMPLLEKVTLPDGAESIGAATFLLNFGLKEVIIGKGLKKIDVDCFEKVSEDITIYFRGSEEEWNNVEIAERGNSVLNNCKIVFDYKD